ncbi:MAG: VWA domain-containing protein [Candidatus Helarchaeota archaeon]
MDEKIIEFISILRNADIKISLAEELDCIQALNQNFILNFPLFYNILRSTLIKSHKEFKKFHYYFIKFFFQKEIDIISDNSSSTYSNINYSSIDFNSKLKTIFKKYSFSNSKLAKNKQNQDNESDNKSNNKIESETEQLFKKEFENELMNILITLDLKEKLYKTIIKQIFLSNSTKLNQYIRRVIHDLKNNPLNKNNIFINFNWKKLYLGVSFLLFRLMDILKNGNFLEKITNRVLYNLYTYQKLINLALIINQANLSHIDPPDNLDIFEIQFQELKFNNYDIRQIVERLAYKIATRTSLREKNNLRGKLNIKKIIRQSLGCGGHPFILKYKKKRITKPEIFVLCDVSGSVINTIEFFLFFLSRLAFNFSKIRIFVFVSEIDEIIFRKIKSDNYNFSELLNEAKIDHFGYSDFGFAFSNFQKKFANDLTNRTTLIIIGDARNNFKPSCENILKSWKSRTNKIIWLNPETRDKWDTGDSIISSYAKYCNIVEECSNIRQLESLINKIIKII